MPTTTVTSRYATEAVVAETIQTNQDAAISPDETANLKVSDTKDPVPRDSKGTSAPVSRIIPDDVVREVPPEELIPYFELPGSSGSRVLIPLKPASPPTTDSLPRSAATFEQR